MDIRNPSPDLYNEDLAPAKERNWGAFSIFNVWTSDVHSLWGYYLAASLGGLRPVLRRCDRRLGVLAAVEGDAAFDAGVVGKGLTRRAVLRA